MQRDVCIELPKADPDYGKVFLESSSFAFMAHVTQPKDGRKLSAHIWRVLDPSEVEAIPMCSGTQSCDR